MAKNLTLGLRLRSKTPAVYLPDIVSSLHCPSPLPETSGADHRRRWPVRLTHFWCVLRPWTQESSGDFHGSPLLVAADAVASSCPSLRQNRFPVSRLLESDLPAQTGSASQIVPVCLVQSGCPLCTFHSSNRAIFETFISTLPALLRSKLSARSSVR